MSKHIKTKQEALDLLESLERYCSRVEMHIVFVHMLGNIYQAVHNEVDEELYDEAV
jgi:hypothetical protein